MKSLRAALIIGLFFPVFCFAQTQTGNASYNPSKNGVTISHASMSFGTRVRVTNLVNNREVTAIVDSRIPPGDPRIADISREAGDAIGMSRTGYTTVRLEQLFQEQASAPAPSLIPAETSPPVPVTSPPPTAAPIPAQPVPVPVPDSRESIVENIQIIEPPPSVQYLVAGGPYQTCSFSPLCVVILILLVVAVLLLAVILVLILCMRRVPWWPYAGTPWYSPVWLRRHLRYLKKRRI
jgi:hypothetical protein